ncbi:MAG: hypothetical protein HC876_04365 [Chloroflexaceae bacterium]|nr:hypothetical protein [Chloroflexaceae bacterium]NJO04816.1 hypothetical protein [Chloroflexaceae bacterium]
MSVEFRDIRIRPGLFFSRTVQLSVIAAIAFLLFQMAAAWLVQGNPVTPIRSIGAIIMGERDAFDPDYPLVNVIILALIVHLLLAGLFGAIFGGIVARWNEMLARTPLRLFIVAVVYGVLLWLLNFYVIAPGVFPWLADNNPIVQLLAHALYGSVMGGLLAWIGFRASHPHPEELRKEKPVRAEPE